LAEQPTRYRLDIVVVMSEARETDIAPLHASLARYDHLTLTVRSFVPDADVHLPLRIHYSRDIYTRLWVATFFDETVDRVLYLDCDMVVVGSLDPLWEADLHGRTVGAVGIPGSTRGAHLGMAGDAGYFNSGVMVIDLARWRRLSVFDRLMAYIGDNSEKLIDPDQDALNVTLEDDRTLLGYEWNVTSPFYFDYHDLRMASTEVSRIRAAARIIHFNGTSKPWSFFSQHPRRDDYFNFLALTSWRGFRPADRTPLNRLRRLATALMPEKLRRLLRRRLMN
jgi:lipopolysaccharide biosynthesis glycosyltransferase